MALTGKAAKTASAWGAKAERWKGKAKASEAELERVKARLAELESKAVEPEPAPEPAPIHEWSAMIVLVCLPVVVYLVTRPLGVPNSALSRYGLSAVFGFAVLLGWLVRLATIRPALWATVVLAVFGAGFLLQQAAGAAKLLRPRPSDAATRLLAAIPSTPPLPVVLGDSGAGLQMLHYAPPRISSRAVFVDPQLPISELGDDASRCLETLAPWAPVRVLPYADFVTARRQFFLWTTSRPGSDAVSRRLRNSDYSLKSVARAGDEELFLATPPP